MSWIRIDDNFPDHPKAIGLGTDAKRFTWVRLLAYTCRYRSDLIPKGIGDVVQGATDDFLRLCVTLRLIDVDPDDGTLHVHDWQDYQAGNPAKAARQARYRAKKARTVAAHVDAPVDADVDEMSTENVDALVDASRTERAHVPVPSRPHNDDYVVVEADDDVQAAMKRVGWSAGQRATAGKHDPAKVLALILKAEATPDVANPAALAYQMLIDGQDPRNDRPKAGTGSTRPPTDVVARCRKWISGLSWDETLDEVGAIEEFGRIARKAGADPTASEAAELLAEWHAEHERRVLASTIAAVAS